MKASRGFLALALVSSLCVLSCRGAEQRRQYNVLFIIADDMRPELGAYGNRIIKTPNIDKLASWGVRFDAAYAQFPLCGPSRTSMLTGRYPTQTGVLNNNTWFGAAHPDFVTLPKYFKQHGYVTSRTGKVFHAGIDWGVDDTEAWSVAWSVPDPGKMVTAPLSAEQRALGIVALEGNGETHEDYRTGTRAIELLEEYKDKPFFLAVGFIQPHSPPTAPRKMIEMYDAADIPLPVDFAPRPQASPRARSSLTSICSSGATRRNRKRAK